MQMTASRVQEFDFSKQGVSVEATYQDLLKEGYWDDITEKFKDPATRYAHLILSGRQLAGDKLKLQMFRHLNDLKRSLYDEKYHYVYNLDKCHDILNFAKLCPDVETGVPTPLILSQKAILCFLQGWRTESGEKRFTFALVSMARTNGKTYLMNIVLTYAYLIEAEERKNLDFGYASATEAPSKKGFRYLSSTLDYLATIPAFKKLVERKMIQSSADLIQSFITKNQILRLTAGSGKFDSFHFNLAVVDEYGDDKYSDDVISRLTSGQIHQFNKQLIAISSAYENSNVPMFKDYQRLTKVLEHDNERTGETSLFLCWEQDSIDETSKPETWIKSNPLLALPSMTARLMQGLKDEMDKQESAGRLNWFQNRNLNIWLSVKKDKYLQIDDIQRSVIDRSQFNFDNRDVYVGLDMSRLDDDSAVSFVFPYVKDGNQMMHLYQHSFVPTAHTQNNIMLKSKKDGINYTDAADKGYADIAKNLDGLIDDEVVGDWFLNFIEQHHLTVKAFIYDYHLASPMVEWLDKNHPEIPFITLRQGTLSLDPPTRLVQKNFIRGHMTMFDDPIMMYSLTNAILMSNNYGVKVDKAIHTAKIDCVDALINAASEAQYWYTSPDRNEVDDSIKHPFSNMSADDVDDYFENNFSF